MKNQTKAQAQAARIVFADEARFRQDSTLYRTWARRGQPPVVPVTGQRHSVKIFGAVAVEGGQFAYRRDRVFNADTYLCFLDQTRAVRFYRRGRRVIYIQDNASSHKDGRVGDWFTQNRRWLEVHLLPPHSPELNAAEPLWHHTRVQGTRNRYFQDE